MPSLVGSAAARGNSGVADCRLPRARRSRTRLRGEHLMPPCLEPKLDVLPSAQREIWPSLAPAPQSNFVLYGGTAIALHLGHRESLDFDFFRSDPLDKDQIRANFQFVRGAAVLQDAPETLAVLAKMPGGSVKISF